jgi:thermostable 8-oxoguanine DNA glycosylase
MLKRELQLKLLYSIIVAGKSAKFAEAVIHKLFSHSNMPPFAILKDWINYGILEAKLRGSRTGNYTKMSKCIEQLINSDINLSTCSPEDLEKIHGIGPKTARFFLLWARPGANYAALDVHILRWLRSLGYNAPKQTPTGNKYLELENIFLKEAKNRNMTPSELDYIIWKQGSGYSGWNPNNYKK